MKLRKFTLIAAAIAACLAPTLAQAAIGTGSIVDIGRPNHNSGSGVDNFNYSTDGTYSTLNGGEFRITELGTGSPEVFKTFCLEYNETIALGGDYQVTINKAAYYGGQGGASGSPLKDNISEITATLYSAYRNSALDSWNIVSGTDFLYDNATWADALQLAIWRAESEFNSDPNVIDYDGHGSGTTQGYATALFDYAKSLTLQTGFSVDTNVKVLNLWDIGYPYGGASHARQSQLYYGLANAEVEGVPEPASLVIWGAGLGIAGLVAARRRKMAKA